MTDTKSDVSTLTGEELNARIADALGWRPSEVNGCEGSWFDGMNWYRLNPKAICRCFVAAKESENG